MSEGNGEQEKRCACPPVIVKQYVGNHERREPCAEQKKEAGPWWRDPLNFLTALLVVGTFGLVGVGYWVGKNQIDIMSAQRDVMTKQSALMEGGLEATRVAAQAATEDAHNTATALKQAQLAERPWIGVTLGDARGLDNLRDLRRRWHARATYDIPVVNFCLSFKNGGRTPARVTGFLMKLGVTDPNTLPAEPDYGKAAPHPAILTMPGDKVDEWASGLILDPISVEALFAGTSVIALYGFMAYKSVTDAEADPPHESRFCWLGRVETDGSTHMNLGGPPAYNRYA